MFGVRNPERQALQAPVTQVGTRAEAVAFGEVIALAVLWRTNTYSKNQAGLQRILTVVRLLHNWQRVHYGLPKGSTPAIGFIHCPLTIVEMLTARGFSCFTSY